MPNAPEEVAEAQRAALLRALSTPDAPLDERFERIARLARRLFDVPVALVSLADASRAWFQAAQGLRAEDAARASRRPPAEPAASGAASAPRPGAGAPRAGGAPGIDDVFLVPDVQRDPRFVDHPAVLGEPDARFYAGLPIRAPGGGAVGTLCVIDRQPRAFGPDDLELLRDLAHLAERELAASAFAMLDELTLVNSRRGFEELAGHALALCRRVGAAATLLVFDLDGFKRINDRHGHAEGDRALADFARVLKRSLREGDVIGRLGGDEFAALLTGASAEQHALAVARLRAALRTHNAGARRGYSLRFSAGAIAFDPDRHVDLAQLLAEADALMYVDKRRRKGGRSAATEDPRSPSDDASSQGRLL